MKRPSSADRPGPPPKGRLRNLLESVGLALIAYLLLSNYVVLAYEIPSGSMIPTLQVGDRLLVWRTSYDLNLVPARLRLGPVEVSSPWGALNLTHLGQLKRGDIVVFHVQAVNPENMIKRVVGLPGELMEVRGGRVYVNGEPLADPWARHLGGSPRDQFGPVTVPQDQFFVMGDNRDNSYDSRAWFGGRGGFVPRSSVLGRAWVLYWPGLDQASGQRWSRIGLLDD